jgi:serine/threonine-protein kinase
MCSGLEEAHSQGIIHRDLKPDNILLQDKTDRPDWVKIVDFGIAHLIDSNPKNRLTRAGIVIGTPEYMAPEQFTGKALDERTDIYALGLIFFEMLTGGVPFQSDEYELLMARRLMEPAPSISEFRKDIAAGSPVDVVIAKCLAHDPSQRYQTVGELRQAVNQAQAGL